MVQLVSLMYREQQQGTIRRLINEWLESSLSESSEDDENNPMSSSSSVVLCLNFNVMVLLSLPERKRFHLQIIRNISLFKVDCAVKAFIIYNRSGIIVNAS